MASSLLLAERVLMGLVLVGLGLGGMLNLLPELHPSSAGSLGTALKAGFVYPLLKGTEVLLEVYLGWANDPTRS
jgi:hypothetical protein